MPPEPSPSIPFPAPLTCRDVVYHYLAVEAPKSLGPRTRYSRGRILAQFVQEFGDRAVDSCTPFDLLRWMRSHETWKSDWTHYGAKVAVVRVFGWAAKVRLIKENPFAGVACDQGEARRAMTPEEFRALLRAAKRPFVAILWFLWLTGCRPGELVKLEWSGIDLVNGLAVLPWKQHKTGRKTRKPRVIPLVPLAVRLLAWMRRHDAEPGSVFKSRYGRARSVNGVQWHLREARKSAGLPADVVLYGARHHLGTAAVLGGMPLKLVAQALGHSSTKTTEAFYVHLDPEIQAVREALARANAANKGE